MSKVKKVWVGNQENPRGHGYQRPMEAAIDENKKKHCQ